MQWLQRNDLTRLDYDATYPANIRPYAWCLFLIYPQLFLYYRNE